MTSNLSFVFSCFGSDGARRTQTDMQQLKLLQGLGMTTPSTPMSGEETVAQLPDLARAAVFGVTSPASPQTKLVDTISLKLGLADQMGARSDMKHDRGGQQRHKQSLSSMRNSKDFFRGFHIPDLGAVNIHSWGSPLAEHDTGHSTGSDTTKPDDILSMVSPATPSVSELVIQFQSVSNPDDMNRETLKPSASVKTKSKSANPFVSNVLNVPRGSPSTGPRSPRSVPSRSDIPKSPKTISTRTNEVDMEYAGFVEVEYSLDEGEEFEI